MLQLNPRIILEETPVVSSSLILVRFEGMPDRTYLTKNEYVMAKLEDALLRGGAKANVLMQYRQAVCDVCWDDYNTECS